MIRKPLKTTQTRSAILTTWPGYRVSWQSTLAVTWRELRDEGDCDAFQEPKQESSVSQNCAHTSLGTQPCISAAWAFRSPTAQLGASFLPSPLPSSYYCFPPSLQNASWLLLLDKQAPNLVLFPCPQKAPNAYPITGVFATQLASPFQHWPQFPTPLILVLIILNCFIGF